MHACTDTHKGGHYSWAHSYSESGWAPPLARIQTHPRTHTHSYKLKYRTHPLESMTSLLRSSVAVLARFPSHQHDPFPSYSTIFIKSSSCGPSTPPPVCPRASSQSVSEKCCCQLTFPITPLVSQSMDTLLTSGDRADREWHPKQSTRATSLPHAFIHTSSSQLAIHPVGAKY